MSESWVCDRCKADGMICKVMDVNDSTKTPAVFGKPRNCPYGFNHDWREQSNYHGVDQYVEWRTREALDGCISRSVYEDYAEFCKNNYISNPYKHIGLMQVLTKRYRFKIRSVRHGHKIYRVLMAE